MPVSFSKKSKVCWSVLTLALMSISGNALGVKEAEAAAPTRRAIIDAEMASEMFSAFTSGLAAGGLDVDAVLTSLIPGYVAPTTGVSVTAATSTGAVLPTTTSSLLWVASTPGSSAAISTSSNSGVSNDTAPSASSASSASSAPSGSSTNSASVTTAPTSLVTDGASSNGSSSATASICRPLLIPMTAPVPTPRSMARESRAVLR